MSSTLRGKHLHAQAREIAFNVYQWIKSQNEDQCTKEIKENVSRATGVSIRTIERIIKEGSTLPEAETDKRFKRPGLDACIIPTRFPGTVIIQTVDFFYPLVNNPFTMGKIACANVLSDLYAFGIYKIDHVQMILSICKELSRDEVDVITRLLIQGFQSTAKLAQTTAVLQHATFNPWCVVGGIATSICCQDDYISPLNAQEGDVLVLTKPLGVQMACNTMRWRNDPKKWKDILKVITTNMANEMFDVAVKSMCRLNKNAAYLMRKYEAHAATDITGFGLAGHAENFVRHQLQNLKFVIHTLPFIKNVLAVADVVNRKNQLLQGRSPETSGGLLICLPQENVNNFCKDIKEMDNCDAWIIGNVETGTRIVEISENVIVLEC
ncbi:hypothetical protein FQA39_LY15468 [Lamprigera yunnana]|nr:hypothetical protein FQA39_LY15468 [Lamprigera yunnana]